VASDFLAATVKSNFGGRRTAVTSVLSFVPTTQRKRSFKLRAKLRSINSE
jgi:hypothetical protein